jgi:hypothetical protein
MNPEGNKETLQGPAKGNRRAEKSGVYSARRRAERIRMALEDLQKDPEGFLAEDGSALYAELVGLSELYEADIEDRGLTDRDGNPRRVVGSYSRILRQRQELRKELLQGLAAIAAEERNAEPFGEAEGLGLLRDIAHDRKSPAAAVTAIRMLLDRLPATPKRYEIELMEELDNMTPEQLEVEVAALAYPNTTGVRLSAYKDPSELILKLASQEAIENHELLELYRSIADRFQLPGPRAQTTATEWEDEAQDQ